jgi:hypothetical protein
MLGQVEIVWVRLGQVRNRLGMVRTGYARLG